MVFSREEDKDIFCNIVVLAREDNSIGLTAVKVSTKGWVLGYGINERIRTRFYFTTELELEPKTNQAFSETN